MKDKILVTGGAGYIGSHVAVCLLEAGYAVIILDNLDNGSSVAIDRVREITKCSENDLVFEEIDLLDIEILRKAVRSHDVKACIHLAGLKAVGESVKLPLVYHLNNVTGTLNLLQVLREIRCYSFVFSSSACVYGDPDTVPIAESAKLKPENPYGDTKAQIEKILESLSRSEPSKWKIISLRYFNPIGAHESGRIGEDPQGFPNNLLPYVAQVAIGKREKLSIFGNDYKTKDGTGVRDYIHISDLSQGHVAAINKVISEPAESFKDRDNDFMKIYNLGTGNGVSVLEVAAAFGKACGKPIPYEISPRRPGDAAVCYADASKAKRELNWEAKKNIEEMCEDAWRWQKNNPNGFRTATQENPTKRKGLVFQLFSHC